MEAEGHKGATAPSGPAKRGKRPETGSGLREPAGGRRGPAGTGNRTESLTQDRNRLRLPAPQLRGDVVRPYRSARLSPAHTGRDRATWRRRGQMLDLTPRSLSV